MGRAPCCSKIGMHRGLWTATEDQLLIHYIQTHGEGHWRSLPKHAGLLRCGKSCRLRWMNYLRPGIKRGNITPDEDDLIILLHSLLGNRWSLIAGRLPGRTDNEIKNYWNSHLSKRFNNNKVDYQNRQNEVLKGESKSLHEETKKSPAKVHQPKAVRVSRVSPISNCLPKGDVFGEVENNEPWLAFEDEFMCSSSRQGFMPTNDDDDDDIMMLDDILDDCGKLDSFINSLLA